jgi:8-oxo-dGTP pyrophosphatase MutT (NUDIX family)
MGKNSNISLFWLRHGEHDESSSLPDKERPLTQNGVNETSTLRGKLTIKQSNTVAFVANNQRSIQTAKILIEGDFKAKHSILNTLTYGSLQDQDFNNALIVAMKQKRLLSFLYNESDAFLKTTKFNISTGKTMSQDVASIIEKYIKMYIRRGDGLAISLNRLFIAREYIYPNFRAKLTEIIHGYEAAQDYINWYENNLEFTDKGRQQISHVSIQNGKLYIEDEFGILSTTFDVIHYIANQDKYDVRIGAYVLIYDHEGSYYIVKYKDGYCGLIGGGVKSDENVLEGLKRETEEEIGIQLDEGRLTKLNSNYYFLMKNRQREGMNEHLEIHNIYLFEVQPSDLIYSQEKGLEISKVGKDQLFSKKIFPFEEFREYLKENL